MIDRQAEVNEKSADGKYSVKTWFVDAMQAAPSLLFLCQQVSDSRAAEVIVVHKEHLPMLKQMVELLEKLNR